VINRAFLHILNASESPLKHSYTLDSGTSLHVSQNLPRPRYFRKAPTNYFAVCGGVRGNGFSTCSMRHTALNFRATWYLYNFIRPEELIGLMTTLSRWATRTRSTGSTWSNTIRQREPKAKSLQPHRRHHVLQNSRGTRVKQPRHRQTCGTSA
jgi:hypothetical protein